MYAIAFDMDIEQLRTNYGDPYNNAYLEIRRVLQRHGFAWQQGSVYFGGPEINAVTCVLAAQGRWSEALALDEAAEREHGEDGARRHRMAACAIEAAGTV